MEAPRERTTDSSRTHRQKTCSFWERERSSIWAAADGHFPRRKLVASSSSIAFQSSQFPMRRGLRGGWIMLWDFLPGFLLLLPLPAQQMLRRAKIQPRSLIHQRTTLHSTEEEA